MGAWAEGEGSLKVSPRCTVLFVVDCRVCEGVGEDHKKSQALGKGASGRLVPEDQQAAVSDCCVRTD